MEWQTIDTAPKDGTKILVFCPANRALKETWDVACFENGAWINANWCDDSGEEEKPFYINPVASHWMPLPTHPQENK